MSITNMSIMNNQKKVTPKQKKRSLVSLIVVGAVLLAFGIFLLIGYISELSNDFIEVSRDFYYNCEYVGGTNPYLYTITGELTNKTDKPITVKLKGEISKSGAIGEFEEGPFTIEAGATYWVDLLLEGQQEYEELSYLEALINEYEWFTLIDSEGYLILVASIGCMLGGLACIIPCSISLKKLPAEDANDASQDTNGWEGGNPKMTETPKEPKDANEESNSKMITCSYCGTKNKPDADKCSSCGGKL